MFWSKKHSTGALLDNRPTEEIEKDYTHKEVATAYPLSWEEKTTYRKFPIKDQDGSGSCVAQSLALTLGIENQLEEGEYVALSARDIYTRRINASEGMNLADAFDIVTKNGATLDILMPSNTKNEADMNISTDRKISTEQIAKIFKAGGYVRVTSTSIEDIAQVVADGKGVPLVFFFDYDEWQQVPEIKRFVPSGKDWLRHCVTAVDFTLYKGSKCLVVQDSWGLHSTTLNGQRIITEDFLKARCYGAGYLLQLTNKLEDRPKGRPHFTGTVQSLQDILKFEGFFPTSVESTGNCGPITKKALIEFQKKYGIEPAVGFFGDLTKAKLLEIYK